MKKSWQAQDFFYTLNQTGKQVSFCKGKENIILIVEWFYN